MGWQRFRLEKYQVLDISTDGVFHFNFGRRYFSKKGYLQISFLQISGICCSSNIYYRPLLGVYTELYVG